MLLRLVKHELVRPEDMPVETKTPKSVDEAGTEVSLVKMDD